jgi:outer membrane protein OmpA-like peptidoglycan-associated protein
MMKKVIICLTGGILLALGSLRAEDRTRQAVDTVRQAADTVGQYPDTVKQLPPADTARQTPPATDTVGQPPADTVRQTTVVDTTATTMASPYEAEKPAQDTAAKTGSSLPAPDSASNENTSRQLDTRWFISPLLKGQFQDFGFLEKNRKGYLSDANTLAFQKRGNGSFAASAYKNITGRLSVSADIGLSFGHVTNDNVLISQTKSKTYNLLNASVYYHLLAASYRLQPYITIGINDVINEASFVSAPIGVGAKFNAKKIMVLGQITYGYAVSKSISNTTMYAVGVYLPIKNKKQKQQEKEDNSPYNRSGKNDDKKKDTSARNGNIVINNYITINMDSVKKAHGLNDDEDGADGRNGRNGNDGSDGGRRRSGGKRKNSLSSSLNLEDDFGADDYKVDTINGVPVVRFVVYFEFNEYGLNSKAFSTIDNVINHLRHRPELSIEIKGYTDNVGTETYNNFLSRRRAKMVLDYLNSRGVPSDLMKAKAYGSDNPVADNQDPNQAWLNRRAEIIVHEK